MGTEIEACLHILFQKLPNMDLFTFYFIASKSGLKVYISIMIKHLRVIFLHFGLKNRNRLSE